MVPYVIKSPIRVDNEIECKNDIKCKCHEYFHSKNFLIFNNINTHSTNDSQSQCSASNNNFFKKTEDSTRFPNNNFNLGFIMLICLLGGNKIVTMEVLSNTNIIELQKSNICCLFHYLLLQDETYNKNNKYKFTSFLSKKNVSNELINLLCDLLSFKKKAKELKNIRSNPWFKVSRPTKISIKELIRIVKDIKRPNFVLKNDFQINNFISSFEIILMNSKDNRSINSFLGKLLDPSENVQILIDQRRHFIKNVSKELGSNFNALSDRIINSIMEIKKVKFFQK